MRTSTNGVQKKKKKKAQCSPYIFVVCWTDRKDVIAIVFDSGLVKHQTDADLAPLMFPLLSDITDIMPTPVSGMADSFIHGRATVHWNFCDTLTNQSMEVNTNIGHVTAIKSSGLVDPEIDLAPDINYKRNLSPSLWAARASYKSLIDEHQTWDWRLELTWCGIIWIAFWQLPVFLPWWPTHANWL